MHELLNEAHQICTFTRLSLVLYHFESDSVLVISHLAFCRSGSASEKGKASVTSGHGPNQTLNWALAPRPAGAPARAAASPRWGLPPPSASVFALRFLFTSKPRTSGPARTRPHVSGRRE